MKLSIFDYKNPIISHIRPDAEHVVEQQKVVKNKVILSEVPEEFYRVKVKDGSVDLIETLEPEPNTNEYYVDYVMGEVTFHPSKDAKTLTFEYMGRLVTFFPASRIWTKEENGVKVIETLQDALDGLKDLMDAAGEFVYKGVYSPFEIYKQRNIVKFNNSTYICIDDNPNGISNIPPSADSSWHKLVTDYKHDDEYDEEKEYNKGDVVYNSNKTELYLSITDNNKGNRLDNSSNWKIMISIKELKKLIEEQEAQRQANEAIRESQEEERQTNTATAIANAETATLNAQYVADNFRYIEEWDSTTGYKKNNSVRYDGSTFISLVDENLNHVPNPLADTEYWAMMARRGIDGDGSGTVIEVKSSNEDIEVINPNESPDLAINPMLKEKWNNAEQNAKGYTDEQISLIPVHDNIDVLDKFTEVNGVPYYDGEEIGTGEGGGSGSSGIIIRSNRIKLEQNTNTVEIGIPRFNKEKDTILVFQNSTFIKNGFEYHVSSDGLSIVKENGEWDSSTTLDFIVLRNVSEDTDLLYTDVETDTYQTSLDNENVIPIGINFNKDKDNLSVYYKGVKLIEDVNYSISDDGDQIELLNWTAEKSNIFEFEVLKKVVNVERLIEVTLPNLKPEMKQRLEDGQLEYNVENVLNLIYEDANSNDGVKSVNGVLPGENGNVDLGDLDVTWSNIENKPTEFPPTAHTHEIEEVIGLGDTLDNKASVESLVAHERDGLAHVYFGVATLSPDGHYVANIPQLPKVEHPNNTGFCIKFEGTTTLPTGANFLQINDQLAREICDVEGRYIYGDLNNTYLHLRYVRTRVSRHYAAFDYNKTAPVSWQEVTDKPDQFPPAPHEHAIGDIADLDQALEDKADSAILATHAQDGLVHVYFGTAINTGVYSATIEGLQDVYAYTHGTGYCIEFSGDSADEVFLEINGELPRRVLNAQLQPLVGMVDGTMLNLRYSETLEAFIAVDESEVNGGHSINGEEIEVELLEEVEAGDPIEFASIHEFTEVGGLLESYDEILCASFSPTGKYFFVGHKQYPYRSLWERTEQGFERVNFDNYLLDPIVKNVSFSHDDKYMVLSLTVSPYAYVYTLNTTATLIGTGADFFPPVDVPIIFHPKKNEMYRVPPYFSVEAFDVDETGLNPKMLSGETTVYMEPASAWFTNEGSILMVTDKDSPYVSAYKFDGTDVTEMYPTEPLTGTSYNGFFSLCDTTLYMTSGAGNGNLSRWAFRGGEAGALIQPQIQTAKLTSQNIARKIALSPNGTYMTYVANNNTSGKSFIGVLKKDGFEWTDFYSSSEFDLAEEGTINISYSNDGEYLFVSFVETHPIDGPIGRHKLLKLKTGIRKLAKEPSTEAIWTGVAAEGGQIGDTIKAYKLQKVKYYG